MSASNTTLPIVAVALGLAGFALGGYAAASLALSQGGKDAPAEPTAQQVAEAVAADPAPVIAALKATGALEREVDAFVMAKPERILESFERYRERAAAEANKPIEGPLQARLADPSVGLIKPVGGPADAPITIVKFHDPNCGFCRQAVATVERVLADRDDVRVAVRPFPVLGQDSRAAAEVAAAMAQQGLYQAWYKRLDDEDVKRLNRERALALAESLGADMAAVRKAVASAEVAEGLQDNLDLGRAADVQGTPTFFVDNGHDAKRIRGAVPVEALNAEIEAALGRQMNAAQAPAEAGGGAE
jgi:protein-disulfide isomerase